METTDGHTPEDRLFVYGSLAPGRPNAHVLADVPGTWHAATVRGTLVHAGWGAEMGFPDIVPAAGPNEGEVVEGFVFISAELAALWVGLDALEGADYRRVVISAQLAERTVQAQIYALASAALTPPAPPAVA